MIQRIQSVYLLLATVLIVATLFLNLAVLADGTSVYNFLACGVYDANQVLLLPAWGVLVIGSLAALLSFVAIFMFKKRKVQLKMCYTAILCILLFYITFVVYLLNVLDKLHATGSAISFGISLPTVAIILMLLAVKGIKADEKLVRSLDRIR